MEIFKKENVRLAGLVTVLEPRMLRAPLYERLACIDNFSAHADGKRRRGETESDGSIGKVSARRVFRHLQIDAGPRRSPSACAEVSIKKKRL